jgi:hypothetical protein
MQEGQNARQQIVERIRQSTSILVAVGSNPSVDALAAALGFSLMLNKMNKHTTAVFSGQIPPAMQFLEPIKTFESSVDALRDFIISLDKEKADRLRYKVEDDVVRIFITPYKTSITEKDLQYSQGDFNVDLIIALGVEKRDDLDKAIISHGRILHDATVITINAGGQRSSLGAIDWNDATASSLCEMIVGISENFQQPGLLDAQMSTALLTGIVAATDRFSKPNTSPRVMTMAAQLMAAGANQQLIAANLAQAFDVSLPRSGGPMAKQVATATPQPVPETPPKKKDGELDIVHPVKKEEPPKREEKPAPTPAPAPQKSAEDELAANLPTAAAANSALADLKGQLEAETKQKQEAESEGEIGDKTPGSQSVNAEVAAGSPQQDEDYISSHSSWKGKRLEPPTLGGTLNATAEEALEDSQKAQDEDRNRQLLTHPGEAAAPSAPVAGVAPLPAAAPPLESVPAPPEVPAPMPTILPQPPTPTPAMPVSMPEPMPAPPLEPAPAPQPEPSPIDKEVADSAAQALQAAETAESVAGAVHNARQEVSDALAAEPFNPSGKPLEAVGSQEMLAMPANVPVSEPLSPDALQALPPAPTTMSPTDLPPMPPMPPLPTSDTALPPAPNLPGLNQPLPPMSEQTPPKEPPPPAAPPDPGQFKIPGA